MKQFDEFLNAKMGHLGRLADQRSLSLLILLLVVRLEVSLSVQDFHHEASFLQQANSDNLQRHPRPTQFAAHASGLLASQLELLKHPNYVDSFGSSEVAPLGLHHSSAIVLPANQLLQRPALQQQQQQQQASAGEPPSGGFLSSSSIEDALRQVAGDESVFQMASGALQAPGHAALGLNSDWPPALARSSFARPAAKSEPQTATTSTISFPPPPARLPA